MHFNLAYVFFYLSIILFYCMTMFLCEASWVCIVYEKCYINKVALPCLAYITGKPSLIHSIYRAKPAKPSHPVELVCVDGYADNTTHQCLRRLTSRVSLQKSGHAAHFLQPIAVRLVGEILHDGRFTAALYMSDSSITLPVLILHPSSSSTQGWVGRLNQ